MAGGLFIVSQKFYKIDYEYSKILKIFLVVGITAFIIYSFNETMNVGVKALVFIGFMSSFIGLRIVKKDELIRTVKSFRKSKKT